MKKTIIRLLSFALFLSFTSLQAQKLRDKLVTFKHISIPYNVTPLDYTTYSVEARGEVLQITGISPEGFSRDLKMQGFKRVNGYGGSSGHIHLLVDLGYITAGKPELKTHTEKVKDKSGNETVVKTYYFSVPFQNQYSAKVINPEGKILNSSSGSFKKEYTTSRVSNAALLRKSEAKYINSLTEDAADDIRRTAYSNADNLLRSFDYRKSTSRENIFLIKKHSSEDQWEKHYEKVEKIFETADYYPDLESMKEKLTPSIEFYEMMASKDPKGDKKKLRIYKAATLNLATIYYYLDDIHKVADIMEAAASKLKKDRQANRIVSNMTSTADAMKKSGIRSIYYKRELQDAATPGEIASQEEMEDEMMEDKIANKSWLVKDGSKIEGTILMDKNSDDFVFGNGGNINFITSENEEIDLTSSDVTAFYIADRSFVKIRFAPAAKGKTESVMSILEKVYDSENVILYKYFPSSGALSDEKPEFAFQKKNQEHPLSLESTSFLMWEKGLANYFADCEDLSSMILEGSIKKTKDDLIKAARVYSEICKRVIKP